MLGKLALVFSVLIIGAAYLIQVVDELDEPLKYDSLASVSSNEQIITKLLAWEKKGKYLDVFGKKFVLLRFLSNSSESSTSNETLVLLHGYPASSFDHNSTINELLKYFRRIILFDFIGFGFSDKPKTYSYSLVEHADTAIEVWRQLKVEEAHLLAHDMGDSVASEILARRDRKLLPNNVPKLKSVTFCNGAMHVELARPRLGQKLLLTPLLSRIFLYFSNFAIFKWQLGQTLISPDSFTLEDYEIMWTLILYKGGKYRLPQLTEYYNERWKLQKRWEESLSRIDLPTHLVWSQFDSNAPISIAEKLKSYIPNVKVTYLSSGHFAMTEHPSMWTHAVLEFLSELK